MYILCGKKHKTCRCTIEIKLQIDFCDCYGMLLLCLLLCQKGIKLDMLVWVHILFSLHIEFSHKVSVSGRC